MQVRVFSYHLVHESEIWFDSSNISLNNIDFLCRYDGQRAQVHLIKDGSIKIFSRNCEDTTARFPDVIENVRKALKPGIQDLIFDSEVNQDLIYAMDNFADN